MAIRVKATDGGFYGTWRDPGDEFDVKSKKDLGSWMQAISKPNTSTPTQEPNNPEPNKGEGEDGGTENGGESNEGDTGNGGNEVKPSVEERLKTVESTNDIDELEAIVKDDGSKQVRNAAEAKLNKLKQ